MSQFILDHILRKHLKTLTPYSSARDEFSGVAQVFLDANENAFGSVTETAFNRYPDPLQRKIKEQLAEIKQISPDMIFLGNGSDEAIDLLIRAFCEPERDHIITMPPTYGMYKVSAQVNNVTVKEIPLSLDFQIHEAAVLDNLEQSDHLVFICSPNNPTGNELKEASVSKILEAATGLVVVDEAYIDFSNRESYLSWLAEFPNLVVLQTFSKAWGLASLRMGMAFASPEIISILNKIKPPYNINGLTQQKILQALDKKTLKDSLVAEILKQREELIVALGQIDLIKEIYPTDANFVLVKVEAPDDIYNKLIKGKIVIRNRSSVQLCEGCLRITVGTEAENTALINELRHFEKK